MENKNNVNDNNNMNNNMNMNNNVNMMNNMNNMNMMNNNVNMMNNMNMMNNNNMMMYNMYQNQMMPQQQFMMMNGMGYPQNNYCMNPMAMGMNTMGMGMNPMGMGMDPMASGMNQMSMINQNNLMQTNTMNTMSNVGGNANNNINNNVTNNPQNAQNDNNGLIEILPRGDETRVVQQTNQSQNEMVINIALVASTGLKVIIYISVEKSLKELFELYAEKAAIPKSALGNKIVFLYNGEKLDPISTKPIKSKFRTSNVNITVFDQGGVIGA